MMYSPNGTSNRIDAVNKKFILKKLEKFSVETFFIQKLLESDVNWVSIFHLLFI